MIIQCESCSRKFVVKDEDIPPKGRMVQCGYCSVTWHQMPILVASSIAENKENLSVESIKASDGKMYKFLGSQWAQLLPSGKTGLFDGDDQILPVQSSDASSYKWGMM